jgi:dTDP-4-dehydrorhamnose 3,5-epimerase
VKFHPTRLDGLVVVELDPRGDERGFFARTYCEDEFRRAGLNTAWPQCNQTRTCAVGAVRGMHWQAEPSPEIKLIRCTAGRIFDVLVDVRPGSATFGQWEGFELSPDCGRQLYVPGGFAHGFQVLEPDSEVFYMMSSAYVPELARGLHHADPTTAISWPLPVCQVSARDAALPLLHESVPS